MINLPIEIGDLVLGGRFKNKKIIVKEIGYDEYGSPTINGRSILKVRIPKLYQNRKVNETLDQRQVRVSLMKTEQGDWILYDDSKDQNIDSKRFKTKDEARVYANDHAYKIINIQESTMSESIHYVGWWKSGDKNTYIEKVTEDKGSDFKGVVVKYGYLNQYTGLSSDKKKGWFRVNNQRILYPKYGVIWEEGSVKLKIEKEIKENRMKKLRKEGSWDRTLKVKVKKEGDRYYNYLVKEDDEDECLTPVGFETKELAKHAAMTKGYIVDEKMYEDEQEISEPMKPTKREKTPGTEKPKEEKLSKGTELKLEGLIRRVIKEEIKKKKGINEIKETDEQLIQHVVDTYRHTKSGKMALGGKREAEKYRKIERSTGLVTVLSSGYNNYSVMLTDKGIEKYGKKVESVDEANLSDKPELEAKARRYAELAQKMKLLEAELKELEKEYEPLDVELREQLEVIGKTKDTFIRAGKLLIKIERAGYDKSSKSYKTGFEYLYNKVNATMKDLANEALKMTETVSYVKSKISVVEEGRLVEGWMDKIKNFFSKLTNRLFGLNDKANKELDALEKAL